MRVEQDEFHHVTSLGTQTNNGIDTAYAELVGTIEEEQDILLLCCKDYMGYFVIDKFVDTLRCSQT